MSDSSVMSFGDFLNSLPEEDREAIKASIASLTDGEIDLNERIEVLSIPVGEELSDGEDVE